MPAISSASAMMWHALLPAGFGQPIAGYGRLLALSLQRVMSKIFAKPRIFMGRAEP